MFDLFRTLENTLKLDPDLPIKLDSENKEALVYDKISDRPLYQVSLTRHTKNWPLLQESLMLWFLTKEPKGHIGLTKDIQGLHVTFNAPLNKTSVGSASTDNYLLAYLKAFERYLASAKVGAA